MHEVIYCGSVHGIDSTGAQAFSDGLDTDASQGTRFNKSWKSLLWCRMALILRVRRLSTKEQLISLLYGQLSGATSLREIVGGLESHKARLYHVGGQPVQRSTLADANAKRPAEVFTELFAEMVGRAHRGLRRKIGEATYLIDATSLRLSGMGSEWAHFSAMACGAKVHVIYDADAERPVYAAVTAARVNDITVTQEMPIEAGATYVSTSATTITPGGLPSKPPAAASSPASRPTRR